MIRFVTQEINMIDCDGLHKFKITSYNVKNAASLGHIYRNKIISTYKFFSKITLIMQQQIELSNYERLEPSQTKSC